MAKALLIGGTGSVGRHLAPFLAAEGPVLVASRDIHRAQGVADSLDGAEPIMLHFTPDEVVIPSGVSTVVDCSGTDNIAVAKAALQSGADLIDISASTSHLERLASLDAMFKEGNRKCIIGVGLAPGLSSIMAHSVHDDQRPLPITISGVLNTRDAHGPESAAFTLGKIGTHFKDPESHQKIRNFSGPHRLSLPAGFGRRVLTRIDSSDQHFLSTELGVPVSAKFGFNSTAATLVFAAASRAPGGRKIMTGLSGAFPRPKGFGPWLIMAETERRIVWATGVGQAKGTAAMANIAVSQLSNAESVEPGVSHFYQTLSINPETVSELDKYGIVLESSSRSQASS